MHIINKTRNTSLMTHGRIANTFWLRLRGLLGTPSLQPGQGLVLVGEKSIHTLFMRFAIDVVYVDSAYKVIRIDANMVPYRLGSFIRQSAYILEMPVGTVLDTATQVGDELQFIT